MEVEVSVLRAALDSLKEAQSTAKQLEQVRLHGCMGHPSHFIEHSCSCFVPGACKRSAGIPQYSCVNS